MDPGLIEEITRIYIVTANYISNHTWNQEKYSFVYYPDHKIKNNEIHVALVDNIIYSNTKALEWMVFVQK